MVLGQGNLGDLPLCKESYLLGEYDRTGSAVDVKFTMP